MVWVQIYDLLAGGRDQDADKLDVKQVNRTIDIGF
jgi:hypothetical protein